jgi:Flp pilus assembly pilin Flp
LPGERRERLQTTCEETTMLIGFIRDDRGQDLIEYTLLLAFVALASAAIFIGAGTSVSSIWNIANSRLIDANSVAS